MAKFIIVFVTLALLGYALALGNHFEMGNMRPGHKQLHYEIVKKRFSLLRHVTSDVDFPPKGRTNNATITYIRALDQNTKGKGGYVSHLAGGINQNHVSLHFKSQRSHGIHFILEIWGY